MKKLLGFAVLGLFISLPAHAQKAPMTGGVGPAVSGGASGGGGMSGGSGSSDFHTLPSYPRTQFQAIDVSGTAAEFTPSSWTTFKDGLAQGEAELTAQKKSLVAVAAESRRTDKPKARVMILQDAVGNAIIQRQ